MKFTKEEISLCKQVAERYRKKLSYGDWWIGKGEAFLMNIPGEALHPSEQHKDIIPLWTISDCQSWLEEKGFNHIFNFMHFRNGNWSFTAENRYLKKVRGEGETRLAACLKAALTVLEEGA